MAAFKPVLWSLIGVWLGLWTICGVAMATSGLLILSMQLYGWFYLGFWFPLAPSGILQGFGIAAPVASWKQLQGVFDCVLNLPLSILFMWCGFHLAAMAWIARRNIERRIAESTGT
jgi:hypothetical protein